ncbi:hypothetical protein [Candidatus Rhabdochlamydia sp. T3358]|uniref:U-box domain-containing protein n=1 Tax=Candidatus Rhabdochlamydia sp. T3358 TaxID=2099795 RepID=UPI0010B19186|nr:hypothetical protein [Candidatus Rhabdochlamydia sp. T3358]VHO00766.1 hypothetical protein RHT_00170 [Candidatus Rhabdochlamydia sp. T3358]
MTLGKIRAVFPEDNRTPDQDLLIGSNCLALTDKERNLIENINFKGYQFSLNDEQNESLSIRVGEAVSKAQFWGAAGGSTTGGAVGGAVAWYWVPLMPLITIASGVGGAIVGGVTGYNLGGKFGHRRVVENVTHSSEYLHWSNEKYEKIIFPALSRFVDVDVWERVPLECPITNQFAIEPVRDPHGHVFENEAIINWLRTCDQSLLNRLFEFPPISQEELENALQRRCPLRAGFITEDQLKKIPDYYKNIFKKINKQL